MDGMAASKQLTIPVLYMAAENDNKPFPSDARAMYAACPSVHKQLLILPGNDHGSDLLGGVAGDRARATLETFIAGAAA
jgi:pimeloyl-ACP methyl ester carboxylesterase